MVIRPSPGHPRLPYIPGFSFPIGSREYPYGMPPSMTAGLQTGMSTYVENAVATISPYNLHPASYSSINNPIRSVPPPGSLCYIPQVTLMINTTYLMSMRHQMYESSHEMVNMLIQ